MESKEASSCGVGVILVEDPSIFLLSGIMTSNLNQPKIHRLPIYS